jgi:hypothetical protein
MKNRVHHRSHCPAGLGQDNAQRRFAKGIRLHSGGDDWQPAQPLIPGALHLTNAPPQAMPNHQPPRFRVISRGWGQAQAATENVANEGA